MQCIKSDCHHDIDSIVKILVHHHLIFFFEFMVKTCFEYIKKLRRIDLIGTCFSAFSHARQLVTNIPTDDAYGMYIGTHVVVSVRTSMKAET